MIHWIWFVLDVGEKYVPEDGHAIDVEDPVLGGDQQEVDRLAGRPDEPVECVYCRELGFELSPTGSYQTVLISRDCR